jgi:hypothetical protein
MGPRPPMISFSIFPVEQSIGIVKNQDFSGGKIALVCFACINELDITQSGFTWGTGRAESWPLVKLTFRFIRLPNFWLRKWPLPMDGGLAIPFHHARA